MYGLVVTGDWVQQPGSPVELGTEMLKAASDGYRVVQEVEAADESKPGPITSWTS